MDSSINKRNSNRYVQPIQAATIPEALLLIETVSAICGLGRSEIYARCKAGTFPRPIRQGRRWTRWRAKDVIDWLGQIKSNQDETREARNGGH